VHRVKWLNYNTKVYNFIYKYIILTFSIKIDFVPHFLIHDIPIYLQQN
jgi:hypothetical protein